MIFDEKIGVNRDISSSPSLISMLTDKGKEELLKSLIQELKREGLSEQNLIELYNFATEKFLIPVSIFSGRLSPLESLSKFMKEEMQLNYHKIGELLNRNERSIWATYRKASHKMPERFEIDWELKIPLSLFNNRNQSILENLVYYLVERYRISCKDVATILKKSPSTIWTTYNRAKNKMQK